MAAAPAPLAAWYVLTTILVTCHSDDGKIAINLFGQSSNATNKHTFNDTYQ